MAQRLKTKPRTSIKVVANIQPVKMAEATAAQKASWFRFWQRLIAEVKSDCQN